MLTIKLSRRGKKNQPFYRLIVLEKSKDPFGDFLEDLGFYNPLTKKISLKADRIKYWISKGAQTTGTVRNLLISNEIIKGAKVKVTKVNAKKLAKKEDKAKEILKQAKQPEQVEATEEKEEDKQALDK
ncbi:30S ribosomal protein S16 [Patescibacteria group bacterium]|nr:30S ribosomal protein S16 [Patescibacteria group bacterium]